MTSTSIFERIVRRAARRPLALLLLLGVLCAAAAVMALRLEAHADTDTLVDSGSATFSSTERLHQRFGDDAVVILVRGDLTRLVLTQDVERLVGLEGCISGNAPQGVTPPGGANGPCAAFARDKSVQVVYGPGTFINEAVRQIGERFETQQRDKAAQAKRAGEAARKLARERGRSAAEQRRFGKQAEELVYAEFMRDTLQLAVQYGVKPPVQLNNPEFVAQLVFDARRGAAVPKARFAYLFPSESAAVIQVRLRPELGESERRRAIELVQQATQMPEFALRQGGAYTVTGAPVVIEELSSSITRSIVVLLIGSLLVMAATLALFFRSRLRLLPLVVAVAAAALTFGGMSLAGLSLTMASIAVLPVLIGLAVDYAIQFQARVEEARRGPGRGAAEEAPDPPPGEEAPDRRPGEEDARLDAGEAAARAAVLGVPTIFTAALATAVGFLVLLLSPVPMVRGFGVLLVIGIAIALVCAITAGTAALVLADRSRERRAGRPRGRLARSAAGASLILGSAGRGAARLVPRRRALARGGAGLAARGRGLGTSARAGARRAVEQAIARPGRVLAVAFTLAAVGWALDSRTEVVSDVRELVPQEEQSLRDLQALQAATGVAGEVDVLIEGADLTRPEVVRWMGAYQRDVLERFGYSAEKGCGEASLCPALSLPDLFRTQEAIADQKRVRALLDAVPPYFSQAVITGDRRTASLAFGMRLMPLSDQQRVIEEMRSRLNPPEGVSAELAGLPVLTADANDKLSSGPRRLLLLVAALGAVLLVLLAVYRRWERAVVPLIPIALATGWSALILFAMQIPLNPMSATLGVLVIAIATEFSVLLSGRYRQERAAGAEPGEALMRTYRSTGAAVFASGATTIAGFAVLVLSDIRMLRDFGLVTVVDLSVALLGVLIVLPAVLIVAERGELLSLPGQALRTLRQALPGRPRLRRPRLGRPRLRRPRLGRPRLRAPSVGRPRLRRPRLRRPRLRLPRPRRGTA